MSGFVRFIGYGWISDLLSGQTRPKRTKGAKMDYIGRILAFGDQAMLNATNGTPTGNLGQIGQEAPYQDIAVRITRYAYRMHRSGVNLRKFHETGISEYQEASLEWYMLAIRDLPNIVRLLHI